MSCPIDPLSSRSEIVVPSARMHARSMAFRSSRTLPSQRAFSSRRSADGVRPLSGFRRRSEQSRMNLAVRYGMSSRRSRSGGSVTPTTFSR